MLDAYIQDTEGMNRCTMNISKEIIGDIFYRNCEKIVLGVCLVCIFIIIKVKFELPFYLFSTVYADQINEILVNLSYSYIAAYLFYLMTSRLPVAMRKKKLMPVIQRRVEGIGRNSIYYVLLEFSRGCKDPDFSPDYKHIDNTERLLASKIWTDEMPTLFTQFGVRMNYLNYVHQQCKDLKDRVALVLNRYKDEMTVEQIVALEEMTDLYIFRLLDLSCSVQEVRIDPGVNPVVEEYCKLHQKYLEVERLFGIEAKE